jgi:predicted nucleic acid-binding protein
MKILDTDHCVAILRGRLDLQGRVAINEVLAVTAITVAELTHGVWRSSRASQNLAALDKLLTAFVVLSFDESAARQFGALKANLEQSGNIVADLDLQIASIAISRSLPLVTHNQQHFNRMPNLQLEDWL